MIVPVMWAGGIAERPDVAESVAPAVAGRTDGIVDEMVIRFTRAPHRGAVNRKP
jgi:hypothetical protein